MEKIIATAKELFQAYLGWSTVLAGIDSERRVIKFSKQPHKTSESDQSPAEKKKTATRTWIRTLHQLQISATYHQLRKAWPGTSRAM
jgi:hypothetical protein